MKDLWDIAALAGRFSFDGPALRTRSRIRSGFAGRVWATGFPRSLSRPSFSGEELQRLWAGFLTNALLFGDGPVVLSDVGDRIRSFLEPIHASIVRDEPFRRDWQPGGPWRPQLGQEGSIDTNE